MDMPNDVNTYTNHTSSTASSSYQIAEEYMPGSATGFIITDKRVSPVKEKEYKVTMEIESAGVSLSSFKRQRPLTEEEDLAMERAFLNSVTLVSKGRLATN